MENKASSMVTNYTWKVSKVRETRCYITLSVENYYFNGNSYVVTFKKREDNKYYDGWYNLIIYFTNI